MCGKDLLLYCRQSVENIRLGGKMRKVLLLAYNGELTCFAHVMLYALDLQSKGHEVKLIIEGAATKLITDLAKDGAPFSNLYSKNKEKDLIACICKACSQKMGTLPEAERQGLNIVGNMQGHPEIVSYLEAGYAILPF
jgi:hypothetical protein